MRPFNDPATEQHVERMHETGQDAPQDWLDADHTARLAAIDRATEIAGPLAALAYTERPSERERREHFDETRVRDILRPRTGDVAVLPGTTRCACGATETGYPHPGHRYACPRYAKTPDRSAA